jgi:RsmE family RNA methyltransferase
MNIILVSEGDFVSADRVRLHGRQAKHISTVHRASVGDVLRVGLIGGRMGLGEVRSVERDAVELQVKLDLDPPAPLDLTLLLALPRPKFLTKVLQTATSLGVKRIYLMNSYRVEKIYWHCEQLEPNAIREACLLGLEQAKDTILPEVVLKRTFKPFVEDEVPSLIQGTRAFVAHPGVPGACPYGVREPLTLAIGPEGGFIEYEVEKLRQAGFTAVHFSERILKVETAVTALISRLT